MRRRSPGSTPMGSRASRWTAASARSRRPRRMCIASCRRACGRSRRRLPPDEPAGCAARRACASMRCVVAFALVVALTCGVAAGEGLAVVTTTTDLKALVEAVGGERVEVTSIAPATMDAEDYQPRPQDVSRLKATRLVVRVGLDYDIWFDRLLAQAGRADLMRGRAEHVDASFAIAVLEVRGASVGPGDGHQHGGGNPHYWLEPKNAEIIAGAILEALGNLDPAHGKEFEQNRRAFLQRIDARLPAWEQRLAALQGRPLVPYHGRWGHFSRRLRPRIAGL